MIKKELTIVKANECEAATDYEMYRHDGHVVALTHCKLTDKWEGYVVLADKWGDFAGQSRRLSQSMTRKLSALVTGA